MSAVSRRRSAHSSGDGCPKTTAEVAFVAIA